MMLGSSSEQGCPWFDSVGGYGIKWKSLVIQWYYWMGIKIMALYKSYSGNIMKSPWVYVGSEFLDLHGLDV